MNQNPLYEIEKIDIPLNEEIHTFDAHGYVKNSTKSSLLILTNTNNREQLLLEKTRHLIADDSLISGWTNGNLYIYTPAEETIDILRIDDSIRVITKSNIPTLVFPKSLASDTFLACQSRPQTLFVGLGTPPDPLELLTVRSYRVCTAKLRPG